VEIGDLVSKDGWLGWWTWVAELLKMDGQAGEIRG